MNSSLTSVPRGATRLVAVKAKLASLVAYGKPGQLLRRPARTYDAKPRGGLGILPPSFTGFRGVHAVYGQPVVPEQRDSGSRTCWRAPDAEPPTPDHLQLL